jgi:methylisocitrate lyase
MIHTDRPPAAKREALRQALSRDGLLQFPGAFTPLSARLIERHQFDGVYVSGAVISAELGLPDIGLTTLSEVASRAQEISRVTDLPTLVDADTGFGEPMNVARSIQMLEDAGATAVHIEDQVNPKRCGHLDGKSVVDEETAVKRIRAAAGARRDDGFLIIARTDLRSLEGPQAALRRAHALKDAGADAIFPEALQGIAEYEMFVKELGIPIIANMTEFGKTELIPRDQLENAGVKIVIYPVSLLRLAMKAADQALHVLRNEGSLESSLPQMQTRAELYELLDYESYNHFDSDIYNFSLTDTHSQKPAEGS